MVKGCERCFNMKRSLPFIKDSSHSKIWLPTGITVGGGESSSDVTGIENGLGIGNFLSSPSGSYMQQSLRPLTYCEYLLPVNIILGSMLYSKVTQGFPYLILRLT